jgi:3-deoxy-D-manno-octulosonate 8-phosphate phosphatase (KDO 8-P phosphatase)
MPSDSCPPAQTGHYPSDCEILEGHRIRAREQALTPIRSAAWKTAIAKAKPITLLLLDVDGVLTDGSLIFSHEGHESKAFNTQDGFGLRLLQDVGVEIGVITARRSEAVAQRCVNLQMRFVYQGVNNKLEAYREILHQSHCKPFEVAYMGDDWLDLGLINRAGFSAAPANAVQEVQETVHFVTKQRGGHGAVREVCNLILEAKGRYQEILQHYKSRE